MSIRRTKRLRYGLSSGILSFTAGWAVIALTAQQNLIQDIPRWKATLWIYLGLHNIGLSDSHAGGFGFNTIDPVSLATLPSEYSYLPLIAVAPAAAYTCYELHDTKLKNNVSNGFAAATGYFLAGLGAMVASDIQPSITVLLTIALLVGGGIWVGSTILGATSGSFPFLGIASLGTIIALGILTILGGITLITALHGLILAAYGSAAVVGATFGASRALERRGNPYGKQDPYPRTRALKALLEEHWLKILVVAGILTALYTGLGR